MRAFIKRLQRNILDMTPVRRFIVPRYQYSFSPVQLSFINGKFRESHAIDGISVEIGCFTGATTVFLNANYRYGLPEREYIAIDTFNGFTASSLEYERMSRGKDLKDIDDKTLFSMNSQERFNYTMRLNGFDNVTSKQMDVEKISNWAEPKPIAFCLIDVDLYLPTQRALDFVIPRLAPGGIVLVDDCIPNTRFDGSLQALQEAASQWQRTYTISEGKIGTLISN